MIDFTFREIWNAKKTKQMTLLSDNRESNMNKGIETF